MGFGALCVVVDNVTSPHWLDIVANSSSVLRSKPEQGVRVPMP